MPWFSLNVAILVFSFKHIIWRFENTGKVHYFQALLRIISLKIYNPVSELVPISEGSQCWKEGKGGQNQGCSYFALLPNQQTWVSHR